MPLILILVLAVFQCTLTHYLYVNPNYYQLGAYTWESDDFREMKLGNELEKGALQGGKTKKLAECLDFETLTAGMIENDYDLRKPQRVSVSSRLLMAARPADFKKLKNAYEKVLGDLVYFPIPANADKNSPDVVFQNGWKADRTYKAEAEGGKRAHEGCDLMGEKMPGGYYPVVSMSDGVIEKIGWLEMGGWRMGIRTPGGAYLYYAHLYGYARDFKEGDPVKAGELLGYMGDTGYGKTEGTAGNFPVHLHLGIYIKTDHYEEMSVNPYWILRGLLERRLVFSY